MRFLGRLMVRDSPARSKFMGRCRSKENSSGIAQPDGAGKNMWMGGALPTAIGQTSHGDVVASLVHRKIV